MSSFTGYVINCEGKTWLWRYLPRWECPHSFQGEATHMEWEKYGHREPSNLLKARCAVWAYTLVPEALRKSDDRNEFAHCMYRVDITGRVIAVQLRQEIGPGPAIVYVDQYHEPRGGASVWRVSDEGVLEPYWHQQSVGYVISPEEGGEWAWEYRPAARYMTGNTAGQDGTWFGELPIAKELVDGFQAWSNECSLAANAGLDAALLAERAALNARGLALSRQLKERFNDLYRIFYVPPFAEPPGSKLGCCVEMRSDGSHRLYEHRPYWATSERLSASSGS